MLPFLLNLDYAGFFISAVVLLAGITLHEFAHAFVATRLGDPTARRAGRLTLNPRPHLDIFGSFMLFLAGFGWAKRIPVAPNNLANPKRGQVFIALAGPAMNLLLAVLAALLGGLVIPSGRALGLLVLLTVQLNIGLAVFNLIPIPPLDGFVFLSLWLPPSRREVIFFLEKWGFLLLLGLAFFFFEPLVLPIVRLLAFFLLRLFGADSIPLV